MFYFAVQTIIKNMPFKSGFVNIIGKPNAGKSTLLNAILGEKLSAISPKVQTTRHRILGILNGDDFQIVLSDTPGILTPEYKLHEAMREFIYSSFRDVDIILYLADVTDRDITIDKKIAEQIIRSKAPRILVINKMDLIKNEWSEDDSSKWNKILQWSSIITISAKNETGINNLKTLILQHLPEHVPYFSTDEMSDRPVRFFVSELIREKIFIQFWQEIPYCSEVVIDDFKEKPEITVIKATIFVNKDSQRPIIIGKKGSAIKILGTEARKDIEKFIGSKVYLELSVKVKEDWRDNEHILKSFGYTE